jgi:hypothetical protein
MSESDRSTNDPYPWAGPALFVAVLLALIAFFWWFL